MSPTVINLKESDDLRDVVHRVVQALAEGKVVGVPTESNYCIAAAGTHETAVRKVYWIFDAAKHEPWKLLPQEAVMKRLTGHQQ